MTINSNGIPAFRPKTPNDLNPALREAPDGEEVLDADANEDLIDSADADRIATTGEED